MVCFSAMGACDETPGRWRLSSKGSGTVDHDCQSLCRAERMLETVTFAIGARHGGAVGLLTGHARTALTVRSLSAFPITDTELRLIAAAATIGESSIPKAGYSTPAAMGTPRRL
jgi:hypothetical protein